MEFFKPIKPEKLEIVPNEGSSFYTKAKDEVSGMLKSLGFRTAVVLALVSSSLEVKGQTTETKEKILDRFEQFTNAVPEKLGLTIDFVVIDCQLGRGGNAIYDFGCTVVPKNDDVHSTWCSNTMSEKDAEFVDDLLEKVEPVVHNNIPYVRFNKEIVQRLDALSHVVPGDDKLSGKIHIASTYEKADGTILVVDELLDSEAHQAGTLGGPYNLSVNAVYYKKGINKVTGEITLTKISNSSFKDNMKDLYPGEKSEE